jgi:hypothetical protein
MRYFWTICAILFAMMPTTIFAQAWLQDLGIEQRKNFFEIQKAHQKFIEKEQKERKEQAKTYSEENEPFEEGDIQYRRWEEYWKPRVNSDGSFPPSNHLQKELERYNDVQSKAINPRQGKNTSEANSVQWSEVGPIRTGNNVWDAGTGRIDRIRIHPTNRNILWIGTPAAGAWRSNDGGVSWRCMTEAYPSLGVSDIAMDASGNTVYLATGDADGGRLYSMGILKSVVSKNGG